MEQQGKQGPKMSLRERSRQETRRRRKRKRKRIIAWCTLLGMCAAAIAGIYGLVKLTGLVFGSGNDEVQVLASSGYNTGNNSDFNLSADGSSDVSDLPENETGSKAAGDGIPDAKAGTTDADYLIGLLNGYHAQNGSGREGGLIIIDAGHGDYDSGTGSVETGLEKDINLEIAYWLKEELELRGYRIYMTRTDDTYVGLNERASLANEQTEALLLVSVHQNSVENHPEVCGVEAWTYDREGCTELGECLTAGVSAATGAEDRGVYYRKNLVVTSKTKIPAVIIECCYMSNPDELAAINTDEYQVKVARGIADGIDSFLEQYGSEENESKVK